MIYTLGFGPSYDQGFAKDPDKMLKLGRRLKHPTLGDYPGGSVWQTRREVEEHIAKHIDRLGGYKVYGVLADWETETEPSMEGHEWHDLLVDAKLVQPEGA